MTVIQKYILECGCSHKNPCNCYLCIYLNKQTKNKQTKKQANKTLKFILYFVCSKWMASTEKRAKEGSKTLVAWTSDEHLLIFIHASTLEFLCHGQSSKHNVMHMNVHEKQIKRCTNTFEVTLWLLSDGCL